MKSPKIAIIGGGSAALCAAAHLSEKFEVTIYEKGKTIGRKFLVAGKGGFNLTNVVDGSALLQQYTPREKMNEALNQFGSQQTRHWLSDLGIPTFIGSSGRVFPEKGWTPAEVLKQIKTVLLEKGTKVRTHHTFTGWSADGHPLIKHENKTTPIQADAYIFALGGGSWSKTGANSEWMSLLEEVRLSPSPFLPSNCGLNIDWEDDFIAAYAGHPLKNLGVSFQKNYLRGEAMITQYGLEGNMIYPLSSLWRDQHQNTGKTILLDFKPDNSLPELYQKIAGTKPKQYRSRLNLTKPVLEWVKWSMEKSDYKNPQKFAEKLKAFPVEVNGLRPVEEAISTVGGVPFDDLSESFEWIKRPNYFCIGEMVDWDAPTGGFLLQGCFAMGHAVATLLNERLK